MDIQIDKSGPIAVAKLAGEFGVTEVEAFLETLEEPASNAETALAIDLSEVTSIDSSGLSALVQLVTRSRLSHGWVVLIEPSPFVSGILGATCLDHWFEICGSVEEVEQRFTAK